jgi:hypothetical protein
MDGGIELVTRDDFFLLLRGWRDSESHLWVKFLSSALQLSAPCVLYDARDGRVAFWFHTESKSFADFNVAGCVFGFRDVAAEEARLPVGFEAESAIEAVRDDFALLIMLLKCDDLLEEK